MFEILTMGLVVIIAVSGLVSVVVQDTLSDVRRQLRYMDEERARRAAINRYYTEM